MNSYTKPPVLFSLSAVAKILNLPVEGDFLPNYLKRKRILRSQNLPSWTYSHSKHFEVIIQPNPLAPGQFDTVTYVTMKGLELIIETLATDTLLKQSL